MRAWILLKVLKYFLTQCNPLGAGRFFQNGQKFGKVPSKFTYFLNLKVLSIFFKNVCRQGHVVCKTVYIFFPQLFSIFRLEQVLLGVTF